MNIRDEHRLLDLKQPTILEAMALSEVRANRNLIGLPFSFLIMFTSILRMSTRMTKNLFLKHGETGHNSFSDEF